MSEEMKSWKIMSWQGTQLRHVMQNFVTTYLCSCAFLPFRGLILCSMKLPQFQQNKKERKGTFQ